MYNQKKVLIIILNYGTYDLTINLIRNIKSRLNYENYSIMVIDNCSPNESADILKQNSKELQYIFFANDKNTGYAAGNNIGLRYAFNNKYEYSWIVNNDIEILNGDILTHMLSIINNNSNIACIGPQIYSLNGKICAPYCRRQSFFDMTAGVFLDKKNREKNINHSGFVYRVHGCCMLLKNEAMKEIDYMDERTFLYGEEEILSERLLQKNYKAYYDAEVSIIHKESSTMKRMKNDKLEFQIKEAEKSRTIYLRDYRGFNDIEIFICNIIRRLISKWRG